MRIDILRQEFEEIVKENAKIYPEKVVNEYKRKYCLQKLRELLRRVCCKISNFENQIRTLQTLIKRDEEYLMEIVRKMKEEENLLLYEVYKDYQNRIEERQKDVFDLIERKKEFIELKVDIEKMMQLLEVS